ncbi:SDR family NAD(P)-dependent oxidoreductase [Azospirillum brasilense]|uniref:Ketoreductase domain-containing protein n=1 Tax=Azospirillum brasilense TaxID=192 RepID=A0A235HE72_AZOBR|nr:SDR family NAD(P)-dependent oxidoreductase [Azospirillum brasilense]OYD83764.1 hypothetical protein CHT98_13265 [Azospirillum brasilense]
MRLKDRIALVTGGARGIGLAIARALTAEGAVPVVADIDGDGARTAVEALDHRNGLALAPNVADAESVAASIHAVTERYGRLDILVNNAGIGSSTPFLDVLPEDWNRTIAVNLTGAFLLAQAAARVMAGRGGGRIVNVTSPSGQRGGRGRAAYGASKAGLELLTKVMAVELAEHGITVNAIAPGPIETKMVRHAHDAETRPLPLPATSIPSSGVRAPARRNAP